MQHNTRRKPRITISEGDYNRLSNLAAAFSQRSPEIAASLTEEIDRARIVSDQSITAAVVRMGSGVTYVVDGNQSKTVTLVYPGDANIEEGRISITTPVGTALIGLKAGQSISFATRTGQIHDLTVVEVTQARQHAVA
ncbi:MAG: nucleoside diphosphate kinase regulator [Hoeflea sp. BRH_c9]|nr:MAG: nucleoside diphosphate kinase regulator [Hoeflea sp. BRH_c9]MDP2732993.1 nucleoside diphosphate kinase regulator [Hoeflea sp.]